jgi:hypothetical protein
MGQKEGSMPDFGEGDDDEEDASAAEPVSMTPLPRDTQQSVQAESTGLPL